MRRQRADVAPGLGARPAGRARCRIVIIRRSRRSSVASQTESQLLGAHDRRAFGACSENQRFQHRDFRAKSVVLALQRERHFGERGRIVREVFGSKRHKAKLT